MSADHRATGRPWATAVALASHTSRGSSSLRHRCAVCTAGLGNGHALRLVRLAARQLTAVAQHLQGPLASARSCVPLRVRSITTGVSHLYRADPSSGPRAPMLVRDAGGCDDGSATRCTCSLALAGQLWSEGQKCPVHPNLKGSNRPYTSSLARIGDTAQSVRASDTNYCRYQHPPAPWQTSKGKERTPLVL